MAGLILEQRAVQNAQDQTASALASYGVPELPETSFVCVGDAVDTEQQEGLLRCMYICEG